MCLTSCEGALDDILGEWSRPTPGSSTGGGGTVTAATITTAPTATAGDIVAGSTTALVTVVTPDGGTMMYEVTATNTKPTSTDGFSATVPTAEGLSAGTYYVWYYAKGDATHSDSEISATPIEVTVSPGLSTALTLEVLSAGTITVTNAPASMQFSLDGGTTKNALSTVSGTITGLNVGDKVSFYVSSAITAYFFDDTDPSNDTKIGGTADVKVYGNIMSLLYTDFATLSEPIALPANNTFQGLFSGAYLDPNTTLKDASGLLLPATTLKANCYDRMFYNCSNLTTAPELPATTLAVNCYFSMFQGCTSLTTAPELSVMTLAEGCYWNMFQGCTSLTAAPVLPAPTLVNSCYSTMFQDCTNLNSVTCLATSGFDATKCLYAWLSGVSTTGTFTKSSSTSPSPAWTSGSSGIPTGWTVNSAP